MSNVDDTVPKTGQATTASVRAQFTIIKQELEDLQADQHTHINLATLNLIEVAFLQVHVDKLDGIEENATRDQSAAEVPYDSSLSGFVASQVQGVLDEIGLFLDSLLADQHSHLNKALLDQISSIGSGEIITVAERASLAQTLLDVVALQADTHTHINKAVLDATEESFTTLLKNKLDLIEAGATADMSGAEIKAAYEALPDTNALTDALLAQISAASPTELSDLSDANTAGLSAAQSLPGKTVLGYDPTGTEAVPVKFLLDDLADVTVQGTAVSGQALLFREFLTGLWRSFNLEAGEMVIGEGNGLAKFLPPFNNEFVFEYLPGDVSVNTATVFIPAAQASSPATWAAGTYLIIVSYGWNHNGVANDFEAETRVNGVVQGRNHLQEPADSAGAGTGGTNQWHRTTHFIKHTQTATGPIDIVLNFRSLSAGVASAIGDITLFAVRIGD